MGRARKPGIRGFPPALDSAGPGAGDPEMTPRDESSHLFELVPLNWQEREFMSRE
jgi:hypothetical protein